MEAELFHLVDKGIIVVYFAAMITIGILLYSRMQSFDDFLIAGRKMNAPLLVCTLVSTYYGLGVLLAGSEISYESGVVNWFFDTAPAYVWSGRILAWNLTLNQDFGILYILPTVIATFFAAQLLPGGKRT